ncbi:E3 ubiquitin-protein ligase RNF113A-like isoform X1 [Amphibalanus amphitrite]|nr:E3 ubiquitin-protein ligase RNF113A-like isoform X1 [Amphibalanus amphitrite]
MLLLIFMEDNITMADPVPKPCTFSFKKGKQKFKARKRQASGSESSDDDTRVIKVEKKADAKNPMIQTSKTVKSAKVSKRTSDNESSDDDSHIGVSYRSKRTAAREGPNDMGATATVEIDTERDRDDQAIFERAMAVNKELEGKADDKVYRGQANYAQYISKRDTPQGNASSGGVRHGPIRAPSNIRSTVRWDYAPDICKDFKETGFCGFGDSCIFMHDRTDYKFGWQLEREMDNQTYGACDNENYEISDDEDHLPFRCFICRESFKDPIVTKCKHYFCEGCALKEYKKSKRCFVCGVQTHGVFNVAKELLDKLKGAGGGGVKDSDDDDDDDT